MMAKLGRYNEGLFEELTTKNCPEGELKHQIHSLIQELERFPRKNRHSSEWFDKYNTKFLDFKLQAN